MSSLSGFLVSSLPLLRLGEKPFYPSAAFLEQCRPHLTPAEFAVLAEVTIEPGRVSGSWTDRKWQEFDVYLRNRVAVSRANRDDTDAAPWLRHEDDVFPSLQRVIEESMTVADPIQRERLLDELRWGRLDDLTVGHEADFEALINYRLRLLLAEKWAVPDPEPGRRVLAALVDAAVAQAQERRQESE